MAKKICFQVSLCSTIGMIAALMASMKSITTTSSLAWSDQPSHPPRLSAHRANLRRLRSPPSNVNPRIWKPATYRDAHNSPNNYYNNHNNNYYNNNGHHQYGRHSYHARHAHPRRLTSIMSHPSTLTMPHANLAVNIDQPLLSGPMTSAATAAAGTSTTTTATATTAAATATGAARGGVVTLVRSFLSILVSDAFKMAIFAFVFAMVLSLIRSRTIWFQPTFESALRAVVKSWQSIQGRTIQMTNRLGSLLLRMTPTRKPAVPMPFPAAASSSSSSSTSTASASSSDIAEGGNGKNGQSATVATTTTTNSKGNNNNSEEDSVGWGVCTLRSKRKLGGNSGGVGGGVGVGGGGGGGASRASSGMIQYDFELPKREYILPLKLGQTVTLCCLDNQDRVAKADFYPYDHNKRGQSSGDRQGGGASGSGGGGAGRTSSRRSTRTGTFSIVAPNKPLEDNQFALGKETANFVRVLTEDLRIGDEVALKPGEQRLEYKGKDLPITDMVYIAVGTGVVPILSLVRAVLPNGSSSVRSVSVLWINEELSDFDYISDQLEREYKRFSTKLAVTCVVDNLRENTLADNRRIVEAIPPYTKGTMAVLSAPTPISRRAAAYLIARGFPQDCICEL